jgi:hypothetical protein
MFADIESRRDVCGTWIRGAGPAYKETASRTEKAQVRVFFIWTKLRCFVVIFVPEKP